MAPPVVSPGERRRQRLFRRCRSICQANGACRSVAHQARRRASSPVRRERLANHTLAMLREAAAAGFHNGAAVRTEPAFATLAGNPEFQSIVADLEFPVKAFARP